MTISIEIWQIVFVTGLLLFVIGVVGLIISLNSFKKKKKEMIKKINQELND